MVTTQEEYKIEAVTVELSQTLESGENQTVVVEWDGKRVNLCTESWSLPKGSAPDQWIPLVSRAFWQAVEQFESLTRKE